MYKQYACIFQSSRELSFLLKRNIVASRGHKLIRLCSTNGDLPSDLNKVSVALADFLASLYSKPLNLADNFFRDLHLPPLSSAACATLNADIVELEGAQAIKGIRVSKAPPQMASPDYTITSFLPSCFLT